MSRLKQATTVAGTFAVALGIGFVMQNGDALAARSTLETERADLDPLAATARVVTAGPSLSIRSVDPREGANRGTGGMMVVPTFSHTIQPEIGNEFVQQAISAERRASDLILAAATGSDCIVTLSAQPSAGAMVALTVDAPCHAGQIVSIYHEGFLFGDALSAEGSYTVSVPALTEDGLYIATFEDGEGAVARAYAPEVAEYHRAVVQWNGVGGFELHARENNAEYGDDGHIWIGNEAGVGMMTTYGLQGTEAAYQAQVYSMPRAMVGDVILTVEAQISAENCGRPVSAETLQLGTDGTVITQAVELVMPGCAAEGDYLVLHNMLEDLTLPNQ